MSFTKIHKIIGTFALFLVADLGAVPSAQADWPGFRGPQAIGVSTETGLPLKWSEKENIAWKTPLPGPGASSPIVSGEHVFVTCYTGYPQSREEPGSMDKLSRHLVCLSRKDGKILWQKTVPADLPEVTWGRPIAQHGFSTSTPVTDGTRVYTFFGKSGVCAFGYQGEELWRANVGKYINSFGSGSSPVLWKNLLIVNAAVEGAKLMALDKMTGKEVWKKKLWDDCWTTPVIVKAPGGGEELILLTPTQLRGIDPADGKELWTCSFPEPGYVSANPVYRDGIIYAMGSGTLGKGFVAVKAGGRGDVSETHLLWKQKVGASYTSPLLAGPYLYFFSDVAHCLDARTGEILFRERLPGLGSEYSSPITADGKIYLFTREGDGYVLGIKDKLEVLARNTLQTDGGFVASPAVDRGQILVRSNTHLYCLGKSDSSE